MWGALADCCLSVSGNVTLLCCVSVPAPLLLLLLLPAARINPEDPTRLFQSVKRLGEGAGGKVYLAKDLRTDELVAIKLCPATDLDNLKNEIALQRLSAHECVVAYKETYMTKDQLWVRWPLPCCRVSACCTFAAVAAVRLL